MKKEPLRYEGGHVGVKKEDIGLSFKQAKGGVEGALLVANRFTTLFAFVQITPRWEYGNESL